MLNRKQKEELVIKMLKEEYYLREIAKAAHMSFSDIGEIKRRIFGESASDKKKKKRSKVAQALQLFSENKTPTQVSIKLDFDPKEVEKVYLDYLRINGLNNLVKIYQQLGENHLQGFVKFYWSFIEAGVDNKIITHILSIADDMPDLEHKIKQLQHEIKELEVQKQKKKEYLQCLNGQIEKTNNIIYAEDSRLEDLRRQITNKKIDLSSIKKGIEDIETTDGFLNLERKVEEIVRKIINQNPTNLPLLLITVLETFVKKFAKTTNYI